MRKVYCLLALFIMFGFWANGQVYLKTNEHRQRLTNGLNLFYAQLEGTNSYEMMLAFRFGSIVEDSTNDGLGYVCHTAYLNGLQKQLQQVNKNIKVDGRFGFEYSTYKFTVDASQYIQALDAIAAHYANVPDSIDFANAIAQNAALFSIIQNTLLYPAEQELISRQWNLRGPSMSIYGPIPTADSVTIAKATDMYLNGYCIEFAQLAFNGPIPFREVWSVTQDHLSYISSCPGELFNTKLANLYPAPALSSQLVYGVGNATPTRYQKSYQGPYLSYDVKGCLAGLVLKQLLTQSQSVKTLCDSMDMDKLLLAYDPMYYASGMTWHIFPKPDSLHLAYSNFDTLMHLLATTIVFTSNEIEEAKATVLKQFETLYNTPSLKLYLASQYWANSSYAWLAKYPDAVKGITHDEISGMIKTYVLGKKYTTLLLLNDADSSSYHFDQFATTFKAIDSVRFHFQRNTATFASGADDSTYMAFEQTLLINPDLMVAINATAYKSELLKVKDDSLGTELSQYKGFYIYPMSLIEDNRNYRLDIYRAATLINKLLKAGVLPGQLKGTGSLKKGDEGNEDYMVTVSPVFNKKKL